MFHLHDEKPRVNFVSTIGQQSNIESEYSTIGNKVSNDHDSDFDFLSYFKFNPSLDQEQRSKLEQLLCRNKEIFVTRANPELGHTDLVKHHIVLKPDFRPKHQRPYRLPPNKKEVLRHHLEELLRQNIIRPLDPDEDTPISSPIVLVQKRSKKSTIDATEREASLSLYRFCVDYRYLNSQTEQFSYHIPDLQELTESFNQRTPNFISSIDMSSGFFQLDIDEASTKYTAFNTCFGSYKFSSSPYGTCFFTFKFPIIGR